MVDASEQANLVSLALPARWGLDRPDQLLTLVRQLGESSRSPPGWPACRWSARATRRRTARRTPGTPRCAIRAPTWRRIPVDAKSAGNDAVKGVGWLTLLGAELLADLGGRAGLRARLPGEIELIECRHGLIVKAGPRPLLGGFDRDGELSLYRQVYQVLAPWVEIAAKRSMAIHLARGYVERTGDWFTRLGHTGPVSDRVDGWRAAHAQAQARAQRSFDLTQHLGRLTEALDPEILDAAARARGKAEATSLLWHLLPALAELLVTGKVRADRATEWLDLADENVAQLQTQTVIDAAAVACAAGELDRAIAFLHRAVSKDRTAKRQATRGSSGAFSRLALALWRWSLRAA